MKIKSTNPRIEVKVIGEYGYEQAMFGMGLSFGVTSGMNFYDFKKEIGDIHNENHISSTNHSKTAKMKFVLENTASKDGGHNKFLESMQIWLDVNAPRFWWSEADTYRVGSTKQSESTMHTLVRQLERFGKMMREECKDGMPHGTTLFEFFYGKKSMIELSLFVKENFDVEGEETTFNGERCLKPTSCSDDILETMLRMAFTIAHLEDGEEKLVFAKRLLPEAFMQRRIWNINYKTMRNIYLQRNGHRLPHWNMFIEQVLEQIFHPELMKFDMKAFGSYILGKELGE